MKKEKKKPKEKVKQKLSPKLKKVIAIIIILVVLAILITISISINKPAEKTNKGIKIDVVTDEEENEILLTVEELKKHKSREDCYTAINNLVYNITEWVKEKPEEESSRIKLCGIDGTDIYEEEFKDELEDKLESYLLGDLVE